MPRTKKDNSFEGISFEEAMKRLAEISEKLEKGDAALDESLTLFEEGTGAYKALQRKARRRREKDKGTHQGLFTTSGGLTLPCRKEICK